MNMDATFQGPTRDSSSMKLLLNEKVVERYMIDVVVLYPK